jgi:hypothetical protein
MIATYTMSKRRMLRAIICDVASISKISLCEETN